MSPPSRVHQRLWRRYDHYVGGSNARKHGSATDETMHNVWASIGGVVVPLGGRSSSGVLFPAIWQGGSTELDAGLIATGFLLIVGLTALGLVLIGNKDLAGEEGSISASEEPANPTGDLEGAEFAVFRDETGDWTWRILHLETLAESANGVATQSKATERIERLQSTIGAAGLLELPESAFRLYEDRDGTWRWTLVRDDGSLVGTCPREFETRDDVEGAVSFLKDHGPTADMIDIEDAVFTYAEHPDGWHWQLLDDERTPLASSEIGYSSQDHAEAAAQTFIERIERARLLDVEHVGVELYEHGDDWTWRFVDDADDAVVDSTNEFTSRREAETAADAVLAELESAPITVAGESAFEQYRSGKRWHWRLVDEHEHTIARSFGGSHDHADATQSAEWFGEAARNADIVEIDEAEYEIHPANTTDEANAAVDAETEWHWRLVTENRDVVAASTDPCADAKAAKDAIQRVREQAGKADLIEFENPAFRVYEGDSGEWRWRLIDEDGTVLADSGEEHTSRSEAAEAMLTLKKQAPNADVLEIETAAFELFITEDTEWGWRLIDGTGSLVAKDPTTHPTRDAARRAMDRLLEHLDAGVRTMDQAIFQTYMAANWHWRFIHPSGKIIAVGGTANSTRDGLEDDIAAVREAASAANTHPIGDVAVQLYRRDDWSWRLLDRDREVIADAPRSYPDREAARTAIEALTDAVVDAPIFAIEDAAIRLDGGDEWRWELVTRDREVLASAADTADTKADIVADIERIRQRAPLAEEIDFGVTSFELVEDETDEWRWRLLDADGQTVATGSESYDSKAAACEALADVRALIDRASILEIDSAAFELHTAVDGWVWRLVDEYGTTVVESTWTYETRTDAREAITNIKSHAPDGQITYLE